MSYVPVLASLGGAAVSSLLGQKKMNPYADQLNQTANELASLRNTYQGEVTNAQEGYRQYDPRYRQAIDTYGNYLATDPFTDSYSTRVLGTATEGTNRAFDTAASNLTAELARRGISGSSVEAGGLEGLEAARASDIANAQNNLAMAKAASQQGRLAALADLYGGAASNYRNAENAGLNAQTGITGDIAGIFQNLNGSGNAEANLANEQQGSALAAAAQALGQYYGRNSKAGGMGGTYNTGDFGNYGYTPPIAPANNGLSLLTPVNPIFSDPGILYNFYGGK